MKEKILNIKNLILSRKFLFFILGGGVSFGLKLLFSKLFSNVLELNYYIAYSITLLIVIVYNFTFNMIVTFRVKGGIAGRFLRYVIFIGIFNGIDYLLVIFFTQNLGFHEELTIFFVTGFLMIVKFFTFNRWVFHEKNNISN